MASLPQTCDRCPERANEHIADIVLNFPLAEISVKHDANEMSWLIISDYDISLCSSVTE